MKYTYRLSIGMEFAAINTLSEVTEEIHLATTRIY
jgi:hypothetical protein